jgi:hypothetical protein
MNNNDRERLTKFETKLDMMFEYEKERDAKICKQLENHDNSIRALKRNQDIAYGIIVTITTFFLALLKKAGML